MSKPPGLFAAPPRTGRRTAADPRHRRRLRTRSEQARHLSVQPARRPVGRRDRVDRNESADIPRSGRARRLAGTGRGVDRVVGTRGMVVARAGRRCVAIAEHQLIPRVAARTLRQLHCGTVRGYRSDADATARSHRRRARRTSSPRRRAEFPERRRGRRDLLHRRRRRRAWLRRHVLRVARVRRTC